MLLQMSLISEKLIKELVGSLHYCISWTRVVNFDRFTEICKELEMYGSVLFGEHLLYKDALHATLPAQSSAEQQRKYQRITQSYPRQQLCLK
jgi:hypothetical protein